MQDTPARRRVRVCYFNTWAQGLEASAAYVARVPAMDLTGLVCEPRSRPLLAKARLDCDWYAENTRVFSTLEHPGLEFLPSWVCGPAGILDMARAPREAGEERWLVTMGQQPQALGAAAGRVFALLRQTGVKNLFYGFDDASHTMPCFGEIAPHLDVLVHDEDPLDGKGGDRLRPGAVAMHRSWVANVAPFDVPFNEAPEEKILFLGSQLGLTAHRERQIAFLRRTFKDRFVAIHDHSVGVAERPSLSRYKASLCPEGRRFTGAAMARSHTDRPFWSGCCGLVPVSEDSRHGGRLEELHRDGLVFRYAHGDLEALAAACERALSAPNAERRRLYEHFNRRETVGTVVCGLIRGAN